MGFQDDYTKGRNDEVAGRSAHYKYWSNASYHAGRTDEQNYQNMMWGKSSKSTDDSYQPSPHWEPSSYSNSSRSIDGFDVVRIVSALIAIGTFAIGQINIAIVAGVILVVVQLIVYIASE